MSDISQPHVLQHYETNDGAVTAATDVITRFGTNRLCWHDEMVITLIIGPFDPEKTTHDGEAYSCHPMPRGKKSSPNLSTISAEIRK